MVWPGDSLQLRSARFEIRRCAQRHGRRRPRPAIDALDQYENNLRTLVDRLKRSHAKVIFATTTPVPPGAEGRVAGDEVGYNEAALRVMQESGVPVDDLDASRPRLAEIQRPANVNFTASGSEQLAQAAAAAIEREIAPAPAR